MTDACPLTPYRHNPSLALFKSLRLPRTYPKVAQWLFGEPQLPFHSDAPLLTPQVFSGSLALRVHHVYDNIGPVFDPFGIDEQIPSRVLSQPQNIPPIHSHSLPESVPPNLQTSITTDVLFTPAARASPTIIVGYSLTTGNAFDPKQTPLQSGTFRDKSHLNGRFAYDLDNDHVIIVINSITPLASGILDFTFVGLTRSRFCYTVPNASYGPHCLPTCVLVMSSNLEVKTNQSFLSNDPPMPVPPLHPNDPGIHTTSSISNFQRFHSNHSTNAEEDAPSTCISSISSDHISALNLAPKLTEQYMEDAEALSRDLHELTRNLQGVFTGPYLYRHTYDPTQPNVILSTLCGALTGVHAPPTQRHRHKMVVHAWQEYAAWIFGIPFHAKSPLANKSAEDSLSTNPYKITHLFWPGHTSKRFLETPRRHDAMIQTDVPSEENIRPSNNDGSGLLLDPHDDNFGVNFLSAIENNDDMGVDGLDLGVMINNLDDASPSDVANIAGANVLANNEKVNKTIANNEEQCTLNVNNTNDMGVVEHLVNSITQEEGGNIVSTSNNLCSGMPQTITVPVPVPVAVGVPVPILASGDKKPIEVPVGNRIVKDCRVCHTCKGLIGRKGIALVDEETLLSEKIEAKKRKNRQSAARSNLRRKEREQQQHHELEERKSQVADLTQRKAWLEAENSALRRAASSRGVNVDHLFGARIQKMGSGAND